MCFAFTALQVLREGMDVYGLVDAAGDSTKAAQKYGIKRMLQADVILTTWETFVSEWMHNWGNPKVKDLMKIYTKHDAIMGMHI